MRSFNPYIRNFLLVALLFFAIGYGCLHYFGISQLSFRQSQRFFHAVKIIKNNYIKPVDDKILVDSAINGMLQSLDNYSMYLDNTDINIMQQMASGKYSGIGVEVEFSDNSLKIITPLDDSPAQKAGILPGDQIIEINQQLVSDMNFVQAIKALRGISGTKVDLLIIRPNNHKPIELELTRADLKMQNIKSKLLYKNTGYIRVSMFQENTAEQIKNAVENLDKENKQNIKTLILDLRNNPGGLLQAAIKTSDLFLSNNNLKNNIKNNNIIVYCENRHGKTVFKASELSTDILHGAKLIILINQGSASAAEIVAGALRDYHRAILVGTQSFGKGSIQAIIPFDQAGQIDQTGIKLTTALYYTPSGQLIDHIGIMPDIIVNTKPGDKTDEILKKSEGLIK